MLEQFQANANAFLPVLDFVLFAVFGICAGNISNMIYFKLVTGEEIFAKQPRCGSCGHELQHLDMLPVIGYLRVRGRCRYCSSAVPKQHILSELIGGVLGIIAYFCFLRYGALPY